MATDNHESCSPMKKLNELKVLELRIELEKRNLDKSGVKAALIERLSKDLRDNGIDPSEHLFEMRRNVGKRLGTPVGKMKEKEEDNDSDVSENDGHENEENNLSKNKIIEETQHEDTVREKAGREAADIIEDALKLDVDHELNEYREDEILDLTDHHRDSFKVSDVQHKEEKNGTEKLQQEKNVLNLTQTEKLSIDCNDDISAKRSSDGLSDSLIVNVNDSRNENEADANITTSSSSISFNNSTNSKTSINKTDDLNNSKTDVVEDVDYEEDIEENDDVDEEDDDDEEDKHMDESGDNLSKINEEKSEKTVNETVEVKTNTVTAKTTSPIAATVSATAAAEKESNEKHSSKNKSASSKSPKSSSEKKTTSVSSRNVWVSGLSQATRASDLQALFKKYGKVVSAKIITNTRIPGSRCYGFITMETSEQAEKCIQNLNKTELHGEVINVEKNRDSSSGSQSKSKSTSYSSSKKEKNRKEEGKSSKANDKNEKSTLTEEKDNHEKKDEKTKGDSKGENEKDDKKSKTKETRDRSKSKERTKHRSPSPFHPRKIMRKPLGIRKPPMRRPASSFMMMRRNFRGAGIRSNPILLRKIENERVIRRREREREFRETERRAEILRSQQRELERKHQEERDRIEREKEKLRIERERLEREKADLIRIEREKARLERERIERERDEIRRRQVPIPSRIDDNPRGRNLAMSGLKRPYETREFDPYWDERKRLANRLGDAPLPGRGFESGPPRFSDFDARNAHSSYDSRGGDYKRNKIEISSNIPSRNDYEVRRDSARHLGHDRDDRRGSGGPIPPYYRDSSRVGAPSRDRDRRSGGSGSSGARDEWRTIHHERRDRYLDKPVQQNVPTSYSSTPRSFIGDRDWSSGDRPTPASTITKIPYNIDSRNRGQPINAPMMGNTGGAGVPLSGAVYANSNLPMAGLISTVSAPVNSNDRSYIVRRF